ncbi:MAG: PH domain-containing protein [Mobiluncus sp.]|nr:PH domain-containing protein [Mobiluncus sp.]MDY6077627.1 PH domain-containing protein [Mobiluncus sp.]
MWGILVALAAIIYSQLDLIRDLSKEMAAIQSIGKVLPVLFFSMLAVAALLLLLLLFAYLSWRFTAYALTDEAVLFRHGIIFKKERHMRLSRIQAVDVIAPLVPRLFGLAKLHVDSAGARGSQIDIMYLKASQAQALRAEVLSKASGQKTPTGPATDAANSLTNGTKVIGIGEFGLVGALPAASGEAPETTLYEVTTDMLVGSILRSISTWFAVLLIPLLLVLGLMPAIAIYLSGDADSFAAALLIAPQAILGVIGGVIATIAAVMQKVNEGWNFTAAASVDGIRLRHGLTTHDSQTIPPGRVHAVVLKQPLLWRGKDWWRVELTMAGYQGASEGNGNNKSKTSSHVMLPVGTRTQALQALWMMEQDLGAVTDLNGAEIGTAGTNLLEVMMYGSGPAPGIFTASPKARWFDWITWNRKAAVLTTTMVMIRDGRITRRVSFVPHCRMQSVALRQGPAQRALGMANVKLHLVPGVVPTTVYHLPTASAQSLWELQVSHADMAREKEPPAAWLERVTSNLEACASIEEHQTDNLRED